MTQTLTTKIDINDLKAVKDKSILIFDTSKNDLAFQLAHCLRHTAKITYCVGTNYTLDENKMGYRILEDGKVVLIKGNLYTERERIYKLIDSLEGKVDYEINVMGVFNGK